MHGRITYATWVVCEISEPFVVVGAIRSIFRLGLHNHARTPRVTGPSEEYQLVAPSLLGPAPPFHRWIWRCTDCILGQNGCELMMCAPLPNKKVFTCKHRFRIASKLCDCPPKSPGCKSTDTFERSATEPSFVNPCPAPPHVSSRCRSHTASKLSALLCPITLTLRRYH